MLAINNSDLEGVGVEFEMQRFQNELQESLSQVRGAPVVTISALTVTRIKTLVPVVRKAYKKFA